jgi:Flp pilus assembly protein TadD
LAYVGTGNWEKGYALLRNAGEDAEVQAALGLLLVRSGRAAEAVTVLERAAKEQPKSSTSLLNLAAALLAAGEPGRAKAEALRAIELEPLLRDAYALLAEIEPLRAGYWQGEFARRVKP